MMNRSILVGRLVKDPELRYTPSGVPVATFTLAVNRTFKQEGGPDVDFIPVVVWRKPAENVANFLKKGSLAGVDGRIQTRNYEGQDGKKVYITEIVAESVQFLDSKPRNEETGNSEPRRRSEPPARDNNDPFSNSNTTNIPNDSFPY